MSLADSDMAAPIPMPVFLTGQVATTPAALRVLSAAGVGAIDYVTRHAFGDWFEMSAEDQLSNVLADVSDGRVFSGYGVGEGANRQAEWVLTEADRSSTIVLLPEDY